MTKKVSGKRLFHRMQHAHFHPTDYIARQRIVHRMPPSLRLTDVCKKDSRCCWSRRASVPPARVVESAATALAYARHASNLARRRNLCRKPALKLSPAPTVSTG